MAGDLEDFLRRAAARRQQKAAQAASPPTPRQPPQYSNRHTERVTRQSDGDEPIPAAELVEAEGSSYLAELRRAENAQLQATLDKNKAMRRKQAAAAASDPVSIGDRAARRRSATNPAQELVRMLQRPGGIQQAILLREILDRPEHRW